MKWILGFLIFLFIFITTAKEIQAVFSFKINNIAPTTVSTKDQEIQVNIAITDLPSESYFIVGWQKGGSGQYYGYTKGENDNWVKINSLSSDNCNGYLKISDTSITSLTLTSKIGDYENIENSDYLIKVFRFTSTCKSYKESDENTTSVTISLPIPTPIPSPVTDPTPTASLKATSSPKVTPTLKSSPIILKSSIIKPSSSIIAKKNNSPILASESANILGETTGDDLKSASNASESSSSAGSNFPVGILFLGAGLLLSGSAGFLAYQKSRNPKNPV